MPTSTDTSAGTADPTPSTEPATAPLSLKEFQERGKQWLRGLDEIGGRGILGDDPGLGKTVQSATAAQGRTLIIVPSNLIPTWEEDFEKFEHLIDPGVDAQIISYQNLCARSSDSRGHLSKPTGWARPYLAKVKWDTVICDEAHYLKGRDTTWTNAVQRLRTKRLFLLTGTPVPNWAHEIYMPLRLLKPTGVDYNSYWRWAESWFRVTDGAHGREVGRLVKGITWEDFVLGNRLDELMLRREYDEVESELPPLRLQWIKCALTAPQAVAYAELEKDYITWISGFGELPVWSAGGLHTKLMQTATGLETLTANTVKGSGKLNTLTDLLHERRHTATLVGCVFRETVEAVRRLCISMGLPVGVIQGGTSNRSDTSIRRGFDDGSVKVIVGTIDKLAHGYNLVAADTCIQLERSWRPHINTQFAKRLHRIGQTHSVTHIQLISDTAVERAQRSRISSKVKDTSGFLDAQAVAAAIQAGT